MKRTGCHHGACVCCIREELADVQLALDDVDMQLARRTERIETEEADYAEAVNPTSSAQPPKPSRKAWMRR
eukprot:588713-Amphidinium_carterae.1